MIHTMSLSTKRQIIDREAPCVDLEARAALRRSGLAALISTHLDLLPDFFDKKLIHDTPAELKQCFDIEGLHTPVKAEEGCVALEIISEPDGKPYLTPQSRILILFSGHLFSSALALFKRIL